MRRALLSTGILMAMALLACSQPAFGQGYGTDTQNVLTPAAGGMAGVSLARPQDVPAAIAGNPSTIAQFEGTQFTLGGAWIEGYPTVTRSGFADPRDNFSVRSGTEGLATPSIGVIQDLRPVGLPGAVGLGFTGLSGLGAEYRGRAPAGNVVNDFSAEYMVLGLTAAAGVDVTEKLAVGASATMGLGFEQLGVVDNAAMVHDFGLRGTVGLDYDLNPCNTVALFYQSKLGFQFPNAFRMPDGSYRNINIDQPDTFGLGFANRSLMNGDLLIAADVYHKLWEDADLFGDIFVNQWAFAVGTQLTRGQMKYRLGYSYNTNPINHNVGSRLSGLPVVQDRIFLLQASETGVINQHRLTGGFGREDFLVRGLDLDFFAGALFKATDQFGDHTQASVALYYLGTGLTWRYGAPTRHCTECIEQPAWNP